MYFILQLQFGMPHSALEMASMDRFMHIPEDSVPCKIRAKRGCATHPRSIAERVSDQASILQVPEVVAIIKERKIYKHSYIYSFIWLGYVSYVIYMQERRTRISGKLKKLQDLVPNMDKVHYYCPQIDHLLLDV